MAFKLPQVEKPEPVTGRHVLIDADVIAYLGSQGCDDFPVMSAVSKMRQRWNQVMLETRAETYTGYLTGKNNFRDEIATLQRYKGNRYDKDGNRIKPQPLWLSECRDRLVAEYGCILCEGQEADDALGIESATRELGSCEDPKCIISSVDKDLRINPGMHHNMTDGYMTWVEPLGMLEVDVKGKVRGTGMHFFWAQMLMGDSADWIKGLPKVTEHMKDRWPGIRRGGCGPKTAYQILEDAESEEDMQERVWFCYKSFWMQNSYKHWRHGTLYLPGEDTAKIQFIEQGRLLWMRRKEGELWLPKYPIL